MPTNSLEYMRRYRAENRDRILAQAKTCRDRAKARGEVRKRQPQRPESRARARLKRYGLTPADYDRLLAEQEDCCACCGGPPGERSFHVDHDHETGEVRGLLCYRCNVGLGFFLHDPDRLVAAAFYLARGEE